MKRIGYWKYWIELSSLLNWTFGGITPTLIRLHQNNHESFVYCLRYPTSGYIYMAIYEYNSNIVKGNASSYTICIKSQLRCLESK